jgi:hypothetical protein
MEALARQICNACPRNQFSIITMVPADETGEVNTTRTSDFIGNCILAVHGEICHTDIQIELGRLSPDASLDASVKFILDSALTRQQTEHVPIIVLPSEYAGPAARIFLTQFLGAEGIRADLNQHFEPGEAAIVNCRNGSRDTLYPNGRGRAMLSMMLD